MVGAVIEDAETAANCSSADRYASTIEAASRSAGAALEDINSDIHASREYRRAMIPVFTQRALMAALDRAM